MGTAYGKAEENHLLNVRADRMGAIAGKPDGFWQWLQMRPDAQQYQASDFLPRKLYGQYLQSLMQETMIEAKAKRITIKQHIKEVKNLEELGNADAAVLATGNLPPRQFTIKGNADAYIADGWETPLPDDLSHLPEDSRIGIIGTGLTAVDKALSLKARGYKGIICMFSRNGRLPQAHGAAEPVADWSWLTQPEKAPRTAVGLLKEFRQKVKEAKDNWRGVVDAVRPITQQLWKQLPPGEKMQFMRRLFNAWNTHRHRMAPQIAEQLAQWQAEGKLEIMAASLGGLQGNDQGIEVSYRNKAGNTHRQQVAMLINCTGPEYNLSKSNNPLLRDLLDKKVVRLDETGLGFALDEKGAAAEGIYPIGTLTVGTYFETTAVPELRDQVKQVATAVL